MHRAPHGRPVLVCALGALAAAGTLSACATTDTTSSESANPAIKVVATTTQICDYVTQIAQGAPAEAGLALKKTGSDAKTTQIGAPDNEAKSRIELTCLLAPNASAHEHEMTPLQQKALAGADIMLVSGVDLEHFLDSAIESSGFHGTMGVTTGVLTSTEVSDPEANASKESALPYTIDRGIKKVEVEKWPFPPAEGESEPEFSYDPHVWTSPKNAAIQVANIGSFLEKAAPESAEALKSSVAAYEERLSELDTWTKESIDSVPEGQRILFSSHDAFGYFSKSYGIEFIGAALSDFNEQQDATASHISQEAEKVKASGARAIFAENSNNSKSIEAIARAAGVNAVVGEDALYGDSLGPQGTEGETYIGSILHNVTTIVNAWNGTVAPVPTSLGGAQ